MSTKQFNKRRSNKGTRRPKEVEINVKDQAINREDLPHVISNAKTNNDPKWYTNIGPIASDYASLPYSYPLGVGLPIENANRAMGTTYSQYARNYAGILTLDVAPGIGICRNSTDPANIAAQQLYTMNRKANSGAINYDKTDLMMVVVAMDSAYMLYEELLRAYRCLGVYNTMNRYMPDALLQSLGFSSAIGKEMANFRGILDLFAYKLASVNIPDQFDFIHRHSWLFTNVYSDSDDDRAQMYAVRPDGFFVWTEGQSSEPTKLKYTQRWQLYGLPGATDLVSNMKQIQTAIDKIMDPILGSQDVGVISGDLAKAFGDGGMIKIQPVKDYEALQVAFNTEVCHQIMNAEIIPYGALTKADITVSLDNLTTGPQLIYTPQISFNAVGGQRFNPLRDRKHLINLKGMSPSPETNLVVTRYNIVAGAPDSQGMAEIKSCGTEIVTKAVMTQFSVNTRGEITDIATNEIRTDILLEAANTVGNYETVIACGVCQRSHFNFIPSQHMWLVDAGDLKYLGVQQDINDFTYLDDDTLASLNLVCVMSEFSAKDFSISVK